MKNITIDYIPILNINTENLDINDYITIGKKLDEFIKNILVKLNAEEFIGQIKIKLTFLSEKCSCVGLYFNNKMVYNCGKAESIEEIISNFVNGKYIYDEKGQLYYIDEETDCLRTISINIEGDK